MLAASLAAACQRRFCSVSFVRFDDRMRSRRASRSAAVSSFFWLVCPCAPSSPVRQFFHQMEAGVSRNAFVRAVLAIGPVRCATSGAGEAVGLHDLWISSPAARKTLGKTVQNVGAHYQLPRIEGRESLVWTQRDANQSSRSSMSYMTRLPSLA